MKVASSILLLAACIGAISLYAWESELYGPDWTPTPVALFDSDKLIQDFSYAGYHRGEKAIPNVAGPVFDAVAGYGADPTGSVDSTDAIQNAIDAAETAGGGVVFLPAGTFLIQPPTGENAALKISASNIVLRGAGKDQTFLLNTSYEMRSKRVIEVFGPSPFWYWGNGPFYSITEDLLSPTMSIPVADTSPFSVGDWILIRNDITDDWITEHNEPLWLGYGSNLGGIVYSRQVVEIDAANNRLKIDAPTRYALKTRDNARVTIRNHALAEVGLENFSISNVQHLGSNWGEGDYTDSTKSAYDTHASYLINVKNVRDSWIRNVDSFSPATNTTGANMLSNGILVSESRGVTVEDCHFQRPQYGGGGGNGYMFRLSNANECLMKRCTAEFSRHGLVFSHFSSSGNVLHDCLDKTTGKATGSTGSYNTSGQASDHHMRFSHSNLVDVCTADGSWFTAHYRPYGTDPKHNLTSAHTVFWNTLGLSSPNGNVVHSQQSRYGYVVGTRGNVTSVKTDGHSTEKTMPVDHVEGVAQGNSLDPFSLYLDQLRKRLELPEVDAGPDLSLFFPVNGVELPGSAAFGDSGSVPIAGEIEWSQVSGPATCVFDDSSIAMPRIAIPGPGTYTFECLATHTAFPIPEAEHRDTMTVAVNDPTFSEVTLSPTDDTYADGANPSSNFGSRDVIWMKSVGNDSFERQGFFKFDLTPLAGQTILSAIFNLHAVSPDTDMTASLRRVDDDTWTESTITWNDHPSSGNLIQTWSPDPSGLNQFDLVDAITTEVDEILSLNLAIDSQVDKSTIHRFATSENSDPALHPTLQALLARSAPTFGDWIANFPLIDPPTDGPADDPDTDQIPSGVEIFHLLFPDAPSPIPFTLKRDAEGYFIEMILNPDIPAGTWLKVQHTSDPDTSPWIQNPSFAYEKAAAENVWKIRLTDSAVLPENAEIRFCYQIDGETLCLDLPTHSPPVSHTVVAEEDGNRLDWADSGAATYRVFHSETDDFSSASELTSTSALTYLDDMAKPHVENFYWIVAVNEAGLDGKTGDSFSVAPVPVIPPADAPRPDLLVGKSSNSMKGDNQYGGSQKMKIKIRSQRKGNASIGIENDGNSDPVGVRGTSGNRSMNVRYFLVTSSRANVTAALKTGSLAVGGDTRHHIAMEFRPGKSKSRSSKISTIGWSTRNPALSDSVTVQTKSRR